MIGENLVNADPATKLCPLLQRGSGKDVAGLSGVNANAGGVLVEQSRNYIHFFF